MEELGYYHQFMLKAISLAEQAKWQTLPNPCVGALLLKDGKIIAEGWHKGAGLAHAEVETINSAKAKGIDIQGTTLVVTLEPCNHHGKMPPCTDLILQTGIGTVVIGALDPNPKASGGVQKLQEAGVKVITGVAHSECLDLIADFITWQKTTLPYTVLKLASTLDGRIATRTGHSQWISSPQAREEVHFLRKHMQAIIVGGKTFYADNPKLTCRLQGFEASGQPQPLAVVVTSTLPDPTSQSYLLTHRATSTIFWTSKTEASSSKAKTLQDMGIRILGLDSQSVKEQHSSKIKTYLNLQQGLRILRQELDCQYVLCEGGGNLGLSLLEQGLVNEMHLHLAPKILGDNNATPLFDGKAPETLEQALQLCITKAKICAGDLLLELKPAQQNPFPKGHK